MWKQFVRNGRLLTVLIVVSMFLISCSTAKYSTYNPGAKLPPDKLKQDLSLLKKILEANHPSLYWYTSKDSIDIYFKQTYNSIQDSLTELQFKNKVAWFITKLRCGHTSVRPSKTFSEYAYRHRPDMFPLLLKTWNDSLIVIKDLNSNDSIFRRGTIITSIEGTSNHALLDSMFQFISTDGYANNFKNQAISFNFPLYYSFAYPLKDSFNIGYIDSSGSQQFTFIKKYKPKADTAKNKDSLVKKRPPTHREKKQIILLSERSLSIDSSKQTAYMRVATFSGGKLKRFFKQSFERLKKDSIPNLIIDLRENSGGNISTSTNFSRYIKDQPFHIADTVAAISRSFHYGKYIHSSLPYRMAMRLTTRRKSDGKFHFVALENHAFKPFHDLHYNGNIYVLQGGYTFSAAAMFVLNVKGQQNVTVVGEETGGGDYGTSAIHLPTIVLPNSKIQVVLPMYRIVSSSKQNKNGDGIEPDINVPPSSFFIKKGVDYKLQSIKEMIEHKQNHTNVSRQ